MNHLHWVRRNISFPGGRQRASLWIGVLVVLVLCAACDKYAAVQETPPPPPPPPSAEDLVAQAMQNLQVIHMIPRGIPLQFVLPDEGRAQMLETVRSWKDHMATQPNGEEAVTQLTNQLDEQLRIARDDQNAGLALLLSDILETLGSSSTRIAVSREWARAYNDRPVVVIKGWFQQTDTPNEEIYAFCEVFLPATGELHPVQVREGDEFFGLKFVQIIGKNRGMRLRYLPTNDVFEVYGPRPFTQQ